MDLLDFFLQIQSNLLAAYNWTESKGYFRSLAAHNCSDMLLYSGKNDFYAYSDPSETECGLVLI